MKIGFAKEAARYSAIAQLVEQATVNRPVVGSSPTRGATSPSQALVFIDVLVRLGDPTHHKTHQLF